MLVTKEQYCLNGRKIVVFFFVSDKMMQGSCAVCQSQLGSQLHSRPLLPSQAPQYGLREEQILPNSRVCNTCHCKILRSHYTHCPLPACPNSRGRVKRLRSLPYRLQDLPSDVKESLLAEFRIPSGVTKCCSACFNRIQRRLGPIEDWPEEDFNKLKTALSELGSNWQVIGERLNRPPQKVKMFCAANRKRLKGCLGEDRKPTLSTDEESGSSTSSCEESLLDGDRHSSDTASAAESPPVQGSGDNQAKKVDYDSSATETADEAQTPDHYQGSATITPVTNDGQSRQNASLSVKDLVLNMIEISLMKNTGSQQPMQNPPTSGITPTISSILNSDSNEVTIVSEYNLNNLNNQPQRPQAQQRPDINIAKLVNPLIAATITPVSGPIPTQPQPEPVQSSRDDLIVLQVPDGREPETLDLSIKKPREPPPPAHSKLQSQPQQSLQIHRSEPSYMYHQERKSPAFSIRSQPKLPSPKPANTKAGSITLGTPVLSQAARYDVLRQMPEAKMGSITQGTPIQMPHNMQEKRVYDYMNKRTPMPPQQNQTQQPQYPGQYRQPAYTMEQQLNSRQTIINDYITSQQMLGRRNEKPQYYPTSSPHRTPPPTQQNQQQRQGVIQRHTRPQYLQPGQEVLSTFVDLAVQQPSLPVPNAPHEGLGKTMADNIMEQPHRYQLFQQQQQQLRQQQQRMEEQRRVAVFHQQQSQQAQQRQQSRSDSSTLTAASLIDAIITHQINQTAEGPREVVSNTREQRAGDLLFQNFHRGEPPPMPQSQQQMPENASDRSPSVISVDLDGDSVNKSLTVKELTDTVISHDFGAARQTNYYHLQDNMNEQWKRRIQQQQHKDDKRSQTPHQQDERQIIRIAQPQQKYHLERVEPVSPPENNHWSEQTFRR